MTITRTSTGAVLRIALPFVESANHVDLALDTVTSSW